MTLPDLTCPPETDRGTTGGSPPRWSLDSLFVGIDDTTFANAIREVAAGVEGLVALYQALSIHGVDDAHPTASPDSGEAAEQILIATNALQQQLRPVVAYLHARLTTDVEDEAASIENAALQGRLAALGELRARWEGWVATNDPNALADASPTGDAHRFALHKAATSARYRMSEWEESLAAALQPSGPNAWAVLYRDVTARITVDTSAWPDLMPLDQPALPMSALRGLASHPNRRVRASAYHAELATWQTHEVPLAACLNGSIGHRVVLNQRRGWDDDLSAALFTNNVDRRTLDALHHAVDEIIPVFHRYLRAKAKLVHVTEPAANASALAWFDLFAPVGSVAESVSWPEAVDKVRRAFCRYDPSLGNVLERALAESWVDAEPRSGKVDGAFCLPLGDGTSRVLLNFDGSPKAVQTLAHELGHAFHNAQMTSRTPLQRSTPMALAETASIFCETLLVEALLADEGPTGDDESHEAMVARRGRVLAILETDLQSAAQVVVDIRSRFLFERELCTRRSRRSLTSTELCTLMTESQVSAYGDAIDPAARHRYMWAAKGHYFTPFYNWPYTFGLLFGLGLHSAYVADPEQFRTGYELLLSRTGIDDAAGLANSFGIDLHSVDFWRSSTAILAKRIDRYVELTSSLGSQAPSGSSLRP